MGSIPVRVTNIIGTDSGAYFVYFFARVLLYFVYVDNL